VFKKGGIKEGTVPSSILFTPEFEAAGKYTRTKNGHFVLGFRLVAGNMGYFNLCWVLQQVKKTDMEKCTLNITIFSVNAIITI
jgi:hypothetical protein